MENQNKIQEIYQLVEDIQAQLSRLKQLVDDIGEFDEKLPSVEKAREVGAMGEDEKGTIVEGVFDGQNMAGPDGKMYTVPANYASKSKLVEGDIMKLTIKDDGSFIYKQIGPVKRRRQVGVLVREDETGSYRAALENGHSYRLLTASVSYYKGEAGDSVVLLAPQEMRSKWAAVENIIKKGEEVIIDLDDEFTVDVDDLDNPLGLGDDMELTGAKNELSSGADMELTGDSKELPLGDDMELEAPDSDK